MECSYVTAPASSGGTGDLSRPGEKRSKEGGPRPGRPPRGERRGEEKRREKRRAAKGTHATENKTAQKDRKRSRPTPGTKI